MDAYPLLFECPEHVYVGGLRALYTGLACRYSIAKVWKQYRSNLFEIESNKVFLFWFSFKFNMLS